MFISISVNFFLALLSIFLCSILVHPELGVVLRYLEPIVSCFVFSRTGEVKTASVKSTRKGLMVNGSNKTV